MPTSGRSIWRAIPSPHISLGGRVLDAGCGTGYGCAELAPRAELVAGIDVASDAVAYAREHCSPANVRFAQASATAFPFAAAQFDLVTAFEVIEHLDDWRGLLCRSAARARSRRLVPGLDS